jgi:hypothetical protein
MYMCSKSYKKINGIFMSFYITVPLLLDIWIKYEINHSPGHMYIIQGFH